MTVPYTFAGATAAIPLSQLDNNFATTITLGNTAIQLGNTVTTLNNMTMANVTISSVFTAITPAQGGTGLTAVGTAGNVLTSNGTAWTSTAPTAQTYPGAGIANSTGSAWGTSYTTSGSGTVVALNNTPTLTNPTVTNYTETPFTANSSTAITIALTNGTVQIITLTGNATITMPTAVSGKSFIMFLRQDATGSRTVTWSTVNWASATAPTITSTASKQDIYSFFSDGTSWYGVTVGQNFTQ